MEYRKLSLVKPCIVGKAENVLDVLFLKVPSFSIATEGKFYCVQKHALKTLKAVVYSNFFFFFFAYSEERSMNFSNGYFIGFCSLPFNGDICKDINLPKIWEQKNWWRDFQQDIWVFSEHNRNEAQRYKFKREIQKQDLSAPWKQLKLLNYSPGTFWLTELASWFSSWVQGIVVI